MPKRGCATEEVCRACGRETVRFAAREFGREMNIYYICPNCQADMCAYYETQKQDVDASAEPLFPLPAEEGQTPRCAFLECGAPVPREADGSYP